MSSESQNRPGIGFPHDSPKDATTTSSSPAARLKVVSSHLSEEKCPYYRNTSPEMKDSQKARYMGIQRANTDTNLGRAVRPLTLEKLQRLENKSSVTLADGTEYNVAEHLHGPLRDSDQGVYDVLLDKDKFLSTGTSHYYHEKCQDLYAGGSRSANIVLPVVQVHPRQKPFITNRVIINDPEDGERIARMQLKKDPFFRNNGFGHCVISTNDTDFWHYQRSNLVEAFLPHASLAKVLPTTLKRANKCADKLKSMMTAEDHEVNMSDFFLHETLAQLQMAMLGETEEYMESNNETTRKHFNALGDNAMHTRDFIVELTDRMVAKGDENVLPSEAMATGCPVKGPLARAITSLDTDYSTLFGNGLIFAFAGHDTTGHTLSWLMLELCRHPEYQEKLRAEVDQFAANHNGDLLSIEYMDFKQLPFMTRCIMETLRLWPAVANGTFREMAFDETCKGPDGKSVLLPKGTYVQVSNWGRHHDPKLWGPDVMEFNPERDFQDNELWGDGTFASFNPASKRFSPFTFNPRHCIGMNFAQMEMRAILVNLLSRFRFELGEAAAKEPVVPVNRGTMGPSCGRAAKLGLSKEEAAPLIPVRPVGLFLKVFSR